jgi:tripartite-type tricarboxylate transporter receptor subunit TctC
MRTFIVRRSLPTSLLGACVMGACVVIVPALALAQQFPSKPVKIVVPFAPGGAVDTIARVIGEKMHEQIGQPVIIENHPGASANIGAEIVAKAPADGYTILLGANALATNPTLFPKLAFDYTTDFAPIGRVGYAPVVLVVPTDSPYKSLKDLLAAARKEPGKLTYASAGNGSSNHLAGEMLKTAAAIETLHVPYKGGAPALTDLLGGRITYMLLNPVEVLPHVKAGKLRALGVSNDKRIAILPDVPTMSEAGLPGFEASVWWGFVAPAKTPRAAIVKLNAELNTALTDPVVRARLNDLGVVLTPSTPEQLGVFLTSEVNRWAKVIKSSNIQAD